MTGFHPLQGEEVAVLLDYAGCTRAVREAMLQFSTSGIAQPLREIYGVGDENVFALMPGIFDPPIGFGAKVISVYHDPEQKKSIHSGVVVLFDRATGKISHVADAHEVTKIRTACASAVATDCLARPDATVLTIIGAGTQAESHIRAVSRVRDFRDILVAGRDHRRTEEFVDRMRAETGLPIARADSARVAAMEADVICTVTTSRTPVLFDDWVGPGTHVNLVGSSHDGPVEIDSALVKRGLFVVDSRDSALDAAAELRRAMAEGIVDERHVHAEIGEILAGTRRGRTATDTVTLYKSLGHICQDLAAVSYLRERLDEAG